MPPYAVFHLGLHCLPKCLFTSIQNEKRLTLKAPRKKMNLKMLSAANNCLALLMNYV